MNSSRILVVDDNPINLKLVADLLECEGYKMLKATNAEEALRIIDREQLDLILLDIGLPGMDGLTLTRKLKAEEKTKHLMIVAVTAFAMKGDEQKALEAGCDGYVTKPVDTRRLPELVAGFLRLHEPPAVQPGLHILVVEDTPIDLKLAKHVLSMDGNEVSGAKASAEALEVVKKNPPQVILLDLSLPRVDGLALARLLKADPATRAIQIVAITAFPEKFSEMEALEAGCDAYLIKPLDTRNITSQLKEIVKYTPPLL